MCYDIKASLESQLKRAKRKGDLMAVEEIIENLIPFTDLPLHHASGFSHPELLIYTNQQPEFPEVATWGLVPSWIKSTEQQSSIWNKTLNARGESIFEKPSFKASALEYRCLVYVDGFYEHHYYNNKYYPFFIYRKDKQPMALAGLYSLWKNPETGGILKTFSIVTTEGNATMTKIHNNPKLKSSRMPVILTAASADKWLQPIGVSSSQETINQLIQKFPDDDLAYHTVAKLRGKAYKGNVESISEEVTYDDLKF